MFETILDYIARTNLFNFVIFASIIAYFFFKLDVLEGLEKGKQSVADNINSSESAKNDSEINLQKIEDMISHIQEEIDAIIKQSQDNAALIGEKILSDAEKSAEIIKENAEKLVENKTSLVKNDIMKRASLASVEIAKNHIINELKDNYDLHNRLIDESIEAINGVNL